MVNESIDNNADNQQLVEEDRIDPITQLQDGIDGYEKEWWCLRFVRCYNIEELLMHFLFF